jgi:hypothetical protein
MTKSAYHVSDSCFVPQRIEHLTSASAAVVMGLVLQPPRTPNIPIRASPLVCIGFIHESTFIQQPIFLQARDFPHVRA